MQNVIITRNASDLQDKTPKAYLLQGTWLPKSQVTVTTSGPLVSISMPKWLASSKGLKFEMAATVEAIREVLPVAPLTPGVYEKDGVVFIVKLNREKTNLYANRLIEIGGKRLTEADTVVNVEFEYAPGAVYRLSESDRMDIERAKELTLRYGRCINCGLRLKDAKSVERGIGPVCRKSFGNFNQTQGAK